SSTRFARATPTRCPWLLKCNSSLVSKLDEQLMSGLHYAVKCNRVDMVSLLMQAGANVNIKGREGSRPIHVAANFNQSDALRELLNSRRTRELTPQTIGARRRCTWLVDEITSRILLSHKANSQLKELDGTSVLHLPSRRNNLELCQMLTTDTGLITCKDKYGVTPLMVAAAEGSEDLLNYFISVCKKTTHGAAGRILDMQDSEGNSSVHFAAKNDKFLGAQSRAADEDFMTPLHWACRRGLTQAARRLLEWILVVCHLLTSTCEQDCTGSPGLCSGPGGAATRSSRRFRRVRECQRLHDKYPVHYAVEMNDSQLAVKLGHEGLVRDICGLGQYIKRQALRHRDLRGVTSLLIAAEHETNSVARTALMLSCGGGHSDIVATMIDKGVDVNASDANRNTALHYACKHAGSSARSLELLLSNGAQLQQNYNGEKTQSMW
uniref:ANK_REP_REGION domain-containing protein n=1 Tax=Macrostomum lignano TaxID=282301 RepID=A0A1I8FIP8_9PLAT